MLTNKEKAQVIDGLCSNYSVTNLLLNLGLFKSSYYYPKKLSLPDKYLKERSLIMDCLTGIKTAMGIAENITH